MSRKIKRKRQLTDRKKAIRGLVPIPRQERFQYDLSQLKKNAYIRFENKVYWVESISCYQEHNWKLRKAKKFVSWELELFCLNNAQVVYLEWERDDHIEAWLTTREYKLSMLADEHGARIGGDDLEQIIDDEDSVYLNQREYAYEDDWAARYYRGLTEPDPQTDFVAARFYEFAAVDGEVLTIEEWMDGKPDDFDTEFDYEVYLSRQIDPDEIEVLHPGE